MAFAEEKNPLEDFLAVIRGSKQVGIVIAKDGNELSRFSSNLEDSDFKKARRVFDLFDQRQAYFLADEDMEKSFYDFAVQYGTGQIEIFDEEKRQPRVFAPDYEKSAVVILVEKDDLAKLEKRGFGLLALSGPAYQS
ncbi:MAG: hypothetical protein WCJ29_04245 [bacterium]